MIDRGHALPLIAQARQLGISRGGIYYLPRPVSDSDLAIMRRIDELHLLYPFAGSRMLRDLLRQEGTPVGRLHGRNADEAGGAGGALPTPEHVEAGARAQGLSLPAAEAGGWFTRRVPAWRVSISLDVEFCIEALEEALARYGKPAIFNSDQGSQFTSTAFTAALHREKIAIRMDGKGCWRDNLFVERLWRSVKYGEVHLHACASVPEARAGIGRYIAFYNAVGPHSAPGGRTPDQTCFDQPLLAVA